MNDDNEREGQSTPVPTPLTTDWSSFNLPHYNTISRSSSPRHHGSSFMQMDAAGLQNAPLPHSNWDASIPSSWPTRRASFSSFGTNNFAVSTSSMSSTPANSFRKPSLLAQAEPLLASFSPPKDEDSEDSPPQMRDGSDSPMILGSPAFEAELLPPPPLMASLGPPRSRTTTGGTSNSDAASPVMLARALGQAGNKTPPPFLQRRLFNEMNSEEDTVSTTTSSGGKGKEREVDSGDTSENGMDKSGSNSEDGRVARRPISRRPNLLPKTKSHIRVLSQLRDENASLDSEIASEATLHRLARSGTSNTPHGLRSQRVGLANRFPEQADDLDDRRAATPGSSEEDDLLEEIEAGSDWGTMSMGGYATEDEEERSRAVWMGIRGGTSVNGDRSNGNSSALGRSPGSERGRMDIEVPSTPTWGVSRPGKRKMTDDRFEPYSQAFKRRAVSPASGISPSTASPILAGLLPTPPPLPLPLTIPSSSLPIPISIPSPTLSASSHAFFANINGNGRRSRAGSPVASSLSSSAGRGGSFLMSGQALGAAMSGRTGNEEGPGLKLGEAGDGLGRMSLG